MIILEGYLEYLISGVYQSRSTVSVNQPFTDVFLIFLMVMCILALLAFIYNIIHNISIYQKSKF